MHAFYVQKHVDICNNFCDDCPLMYVGIAMNIQEWLNFNHVQYVALQFINLGYKLQDSFGENSLSILPCTMHMVCPLSILSPPSFNQHTSGQ